MGSVADNLRHWSLYEWSDRGDEWSAGWGGTEYLWHGTILPRIRAFVPTESILEIAPGYGRCTQHLKDLCEELTVVDLAENCIDACRKRFASCSHVRYFVNDGKSLDMIEDESVDFVFSWDSLVHAESEVLRCYLEQLSSKLKPGGYGFIHHSTIGAFKDRATGELTVENPHWRAESMTAELFRQYCDDAGLTCLSQEIVNWGCENLTDSFSLFTGDAVPSYGDPVRTENPGLMEEAQRLKRLSELCVPATLFEQKVAQLAEAGDLQQAETLFNEVLRHSPAATGLRYRYALMLHSTGRTEDALHQLEELVALAPDNSRAHNDIGALYYQLGDKEEALSHFQRAVALDGNDLTAPKNLADLFLELGRTQEAVSQYQAVLSQDPEDVDVLLSLGNVCSELGRGEKAAVFYTRVLQIDPANTIARRKLESLNHSGATGTNLDTTEVASYEAYKEHAAGMQSEYAERQRYEKNLIVNSKPFTVRSYCYFCKSETDFLVDYSYSYEVNGILTPNWRERLICPSCGLINRMRASIHLFEQLLEPAEESRIYVAEQRTPVYAWLSRRCPKAVGSEYLGETVPFGQTDTDGVRNESITGLSFSDDEFDFVLTFDVFEHIADFEKAFLECYRVLKPAGTLFFTVPFNVDSEKNGVCAVLKGTGEIEHLLPPEHHGPWLVFNRFGWEMLDQLRAVGFDDVNAHLFWSKELGYLGHEQTVFVATKGGFERGFQDGQSESRAGAGVPLAGEGKSPERVSRSRRTATRAKKEAGLICLSPFYWMNFFYEKVYCCCPGWTKMAIGNIGDNSIAGIWNSEQARYIRRKMYEGEWREICNSICPTIAAHRHDGRLIKYGELEKSDFLTPELVEEIRCRKERLESFPTLFKPDNSNVCNLSCIMCDKDVYTDDPGLIDKTTDDMSNYLATAKIIVLSGIGDPLAIPYARNWLTNGRSDGSGPRFDLITNGLLLPKYWERIKHQKFGSIQVSVDAATRETYEKIRVGGSWDDLLRSLSLLQENRDKFSHVGITMVVMKANYREIPAFVDLAESYGFGASFQKIVGSYGDQNIFETGDTLTLDELRHTIADERSRERSRGVCWNNLIDLV